MNCPMCGNELWQDLWKEFYSGLWHCSYCSYYGNPDQKTITTGNTTENNRKESNE